MNFNNYLFYHIIKWYFFWQFADLISNKNLLNFLEISVEMEKKGLISFSQFSN